MKEAFLEEEIRIEKNRLGEVALWEKWGPFVSERSWGTVREDYSSNGDSWSYLSHDMARSVAYRFGEDGIAGISDRYQACAFSIALWNHHDPILKERLFGLTPSEGNHGEDVKEMYYYLENCPSHAFMRYLYKYPQKAFPYEELVKENKIRTNKEPEYEIYDTDAFKDDSYFDVMIEYAKVDSEEIAVRIEVTNQSLNDALIDVIPQLVFRNTWSATGDEPKQEIYIHKENENYSSVVFDDNGVEVFPMLDVSYSLGKRYLYGSSGALLLFTNNETNLERFRGEKNKTPFVKDAFHRHIINGENCTNPKRSGTKVGFHYKDVKLKGKEKRVFYFRLSRMELEHPLKNNDAICKEREKELHAFYDKKLSTPKDSIENKIQRLSIYGQLWSRQLYLFIVNYWIKGDANHQRLSTWESIRNSSWRHLVSKHIITMPDKWEYPWFAAWDLAFHSLSMLLYDVNLAKDQLQLLISEMFQHPNGQIPAYEWNFSDLNPPIQAYAALKIYLHEEKVSGRGDIHFLKECFQKLLMNFVWWVNQEDRAGKNIFQGGFLGLDNITVIDRSQPLPNGEYLEQSDATGWMGLFCLNMMRIAMIISEQDPDFEEMICKFFRHYIYIAKSLTENNWSKEDNFFYDVVAYPDGSSKQIPVRSLVGIIPLFAVDSFTDSYLKQFKSFYQEFVWFRENRNDLVENCFTLIKKGEQSTYFFSFLPPNLITKVLESCIDPDEFQSDYGLRSLSKFHENNPVTFENNSIAYTPGESNVYLFGGNSNWRGPIWMPIAYMFNEMLDRLDVVLGDSYKVSGKSFKEVREFEKSALLRLFTEGEDGVIPSQPKNLPWKGHLMFYEYFHGDTGKGLGASHQTGWTTLIANLLDR